MKKSTLFFCTAMLFTAVFSCAPKQSVPTTVEPYAEGKPYTRWWWFASEIQKEDVKYQLEWLKEQGFGGVEIAWVYPMEGDSTVARTKWLSPEWAEPVNYAKQVADSLGLGCDFTYATLRCLQLRRSLCRGHYTLGHRQ